MYIILRNYTRNGAAQLQSSPEHRQELWMSTKAQYIVSTNALDWLIQLPNALELATQRLQYLVRTVSCGFSISTGDLELQVPQTQPRKWRDTYNVQRRLRSFGIKSRRVAVEMSFGRHWRDVRLNWLRRHCPNVLPALDGAMYSSLTIYRLDVSTSQWTYTDIASI